MKLLFINCQKLKVETLSKGIDIQPHFQTQANIQIRSRLTKRTQIKMFTKCSSIFGFSKLTAQAEMQPAAGRGSARDASGQDNNDDSDPVWVSTGIDGSDDE
jgi:hypothetical protein